MTFTLILLFQLTTANPAMIVVKHISGEKECVALAQTLANAFEVQAQFQCKREMTT